MVTNTELARKVSQLMDPMSEGGRNSQVVNATTMVFQAVGRYVTTMFCSGNYEAILIEIPTLGFFLRNASR